MKRPVLWRKRVSPLPLRALYTLPELARAATMSRERLLRLFERLGVTMIRSGKVWLAPLSELERKAWPFWESIRAAETLRHLHAEDE
jgi:hypothetical protein